MAKITIAELDINVQALIASTSEVKKRIDDLKKQQAELTKSGDTNSKTFIDNAAALRALGAEYTAGLRGITETNKAITEQANRTQLLDMALKGEVSSITEAREANKLLNQLRNDTNVLSAKGQLELIKLNAAIDENNEFIKRNADALTQQKINIGNYSDSIKDALQNLNPLNGGLAGFTQRSQEAGGVGNLLKSSLSGAATGFMGLVKASLAFIATPIGAVLAAIVLAFSLVKNAMNRSEESTNKIAKVFSIFSGITNKLLKFLEPLGEFLIDGIVAGFELAAAAAENAINIISGGLSFLGFDDAAKSVNNFKEEIKGAVRDSAALADAEAELEKQQRKSQLTQLEYQKNAEKLRQTRDNENLTIRERIQANEDLGVVLQAQLKDELAIAQQALIVANLRILAEGKTKEALDRQSEALTTIADITERITGQESEQLQNSVSLQKEAAAQRKEISDKAREKAKEDTDAAISESKTQLDLFIAQQGIRARSLQEEVKLAEQVRDKKIKILDQELKANKLTQSEFNLQKLTTQQAFLQKQNELIVSYSKAELDLFLSLNQSKLTGEQLLTQALIDEEAKRLDSIRSEKLKQLELDKATNQQIIDEKRANNESLSQVDLEFLTQKNAIELEFANQNKANLKTLEDQTKAEKAAQLEADNEIALANAATKLEEDKIRAQQEFDEEIALLTAKLEKKKITQAQFDALKIIAEKKTKEALRLADLEDTETKLNEYKKLGEGLQVLFGKNKLIASALAGINTALGVTEILKEPAPDLISGSILRAIRIATTIATGAKAVAEINGAKFEKGGIQEIGGKRHSAGGTKFHGEDGTRFEAEAGEGIGVLNRGAFAAFMDFNNRFSSGGKSTPNFMAGGGVITQGVTSSAPGLNVNDLLTAIQSMPAPVVTVEDINAKTSEVIRVEQGANF